MTVNWRQRKSSADGRLLIAILLAGVSALVALACGGPPRKADEPRTPKTVVILFDMSDSTRAAVAREMYAETSKVILNTLKPGDAIVCGLITSQSESELRLPINEVFEPPKPKVNTRLMRRAAEKRAEEAAKETIENVKSRVASLLLDQKVSVPRTDILGSLALSERIFRAYDHPKKILVIVSDMLEDSPRIRLSREHLTPERIRALVERERTEGRLPDLHGVKVYVVGASHPDRDRYRAVKEFWFSYFGSVGADITTERYGPTLIRFNE
jgi:hypothetical protein